MRVEFRFNGEHQLLLIPESGKDKQLLQIMFAERPEIKTIASKDPEVMIIQASECSQKAVEEKVYSQARELRETESYK